MLRRLNRANGPQASRTVRKTSVPDASDSSVLFSFRYLTGEDHYNLRALEQGKGELRSRELLRKLYTIGQFSWNELTSKGKRSDGYELLPVQALKTDILDRLDAGMKDTLKSVMVFRFGNARMVGFKAKGSRVFYILGFDWNYSLYDHG